MKQLNQVLKDIEALIGMTLNSIRPGANLQVLEVDYDGERVIVETSTGKKQSRSFSELQSILDFLNREKIVHVETALKGSGSSRNQPETLLANLPYIEYAYINQKKHLVLKDANTHPPGTIQQMDLLEAKQLLDQIQDNANRLPQQIIVTNDLKSTADVLRNLGGKVSALGQTAYSVDFEAGCIWITRSDVLNTSQIGSFTLLEATPTDQSVCIGELAGFRFYEEGAFILTLTERTSG